MPSLLLISPDMADFSKISIPGPTLSSLLSPSHSSTGLLFGHVTTLPSTCPTDDADPTPSSTQPTTLSLTIISFVSVPYFNSLGLLSPLTSPNPNPNPRSGTLLLGWFSSRPSSPLRPSIRDLAVSHHLSQTLTLTPNSKTCIFLLLSSFTTPNLAVHTHEYRAFVYGGSKLRPISVDVINVGPKFRGQYGGFVPDSSVMFPMIQVPDSRDLIEGDMEVESGGKGNDGGEWEVEGFGLERLEGMMGAEYTGELEDLYGKMMGKLEGLVRMVEVSSAKVRDQESRNSILRYKIVGLE